MPETIYHLFVECEKVKIFWNNFNNNANIDITLENRNILFAYQDNVKLWYWPNIISMQINSIMR